MRTSAFLITMIVCLTTLLVAAPARADITIGVVSAFTGANAPFGEQMKRGAEQAAADINAKGGVLGQKLVLRYTDDACDPKQAVTAATKLVSEGVKFVLGHLCSNASVPASKIYAEEGIMMVTPTATNPALTESGLTNVFRTIGRDDQEGKVIGKYILKHFPGKKIAIAQDRSVWGLGIATGVKNTLNAAGVKEVLFESVTPGERDYSALISKLKQADANVLFLGTFFTEAGLIVRQMKEQGASMQVIGGDALATDQFWSITGPAGEGMLMGYLVDPRSLPEAQSAVAALRKSGYEPEGYTLNTYAALQVIAAGITRAGAPDPVKAAAAVRQAPVDTVYGKLTYDAKGDINGSRYIMYRWHDGKYLPAGD